MAVSCLRQQIGTPKDAACPHGFVFQTDGFVAHDVAQSRRNHQNW
ncbi:MAG TPA: hypothetical protein VGF08_00910 [Terriglobales bacterium]|jgi:hypothetical protein